MRREGKRGVFSFSLFFVRKQSPSPFRSDITPRSQASLPNCSHLYALCIVFLKNFDRQVPDFASEIKMSGNFIKKAIPAGKVIKSGVEIALQVAIETRDWTRPSDVAAAQAPALKEAVEQNRKPLPPNTAMVIGR